MTKYQLAKLILMAGGLQSRKRLQKTVHLLQAAGCPLGLGFRLHYYGPYSRELADTVDRMTRAGVLVETPRETQVGTQYDYKFDEQMRESLEAYERTPHGEAAKEELETYEELLKTLSDTPPRVLELASTVVAFREAGLGWDEALAETAGFKRERIDSPMMNKAGDLARTVVSSDDG